MKDFEVRQEPDVIPGRRLLTIAVLSVVIGAAGVLGAVWLAGLATSSARRAPSFVSPVAAGKALAGIHQTPIAESPVAARERARARDALSHYAWVDRDGGIAAIPIERAIDLVAEDSR